MLSRQQRAGMQTTCSRCADAVYSAAATKASHQQCKYSSLVSNKKVRREEQVIRRSSKSNSRRAVLRATPHPVLPLQKSRPT